MGAKSLQISKHLEGVIVAISYFRQDMKVVRSFYFPLLMKEIRKGMSKCNNCFKGIDMFNPRVGKLYHVDPTTLPPVNNSQVASGDNTIQQCFVRYIYPALPDNVNLNYYAIADNAVDANGDLIEGPSFNVYNAVSGAECPDTPQLSTCCGNTYPPQTLVGTISISRDPQGFVFLAPTGPTPAPQPILLGYKNEFHRTFQALLRVEMYYHLVTAGQGQTAYLPVATPGSPCPPAPSPPQTCVDFNSAGSSERNTAPGSTLPDVAPTCTGLYTPCQQAFFINTSPAILVACPTGKRADFMHTQTFGFYGSCDPAIAANDISITDEPGSGAFNDLIGNCWSANVWQECNTLDPYDIINRGYFSYFESVASYTGDLFVRFGVIESQLDYILKLWDQAATIDSSSIKPRFEHKYYNGGSGGSMPVAGFFEQTKYRFDLISLNSNFCPKLAMDYLSIDTAFLFNWNVNGNPGVPFSIEQLSVILGVPTPFIQNPNNSVDVVAASYRASFADYYQDVAATNNHPFDWTPPFPDQDPTNTGFSRNPNNIIDSVLRGNYTPDQLVIQPDGTVIPAWYDNIDIIYGGKLVNEHYLPVGINVVNYYTNTDPITGLYPSYVVTKEKSVPGYLLPPAKQSDKISNGGTIPDVAVDQQRQLGYRAFVKSDVDAINAPYNYQVLTSAPWSQLTVGSGIRRSKADAFALKLTAAQWNYRLDGKSRIFKTNFLLGVNSDLIAGFIYVHPPNLQNEVFAAYDINKRHTKNKTCRKELFVQWSTTPYDPFIPNTPSRAQDFLDGNLLYPEGSFTLKEALGGNFLPTGPNSIEQMRQDGAPTDQPDEVIAFKTAIAEPFFKLQAVQAPEPTPQVPFLTFDGWLFTLTSPTTQATLQQDNSQEKLCSFQERLLAIRNRLLKNDEFCKPLKNRNGQDIIIDGKKVYLTPEYDNQLAVLIKGKPNPIILAMLTNYY